MLNILTLSGTLNAMVPISRFNRGEANKIFDEVRESGCMVVVKNNTPACVLITPERYQEMVDLIEDQFLLALAEERMKRDTGITHSAEEVYAELGIENDGFDETEMVYGVDFE